MLSDSPSRRGTRACLKRSHLALRGWPFTKLARDLNAHRGKPIHLVSSQ
jgi:hypothetical protein